MEQPAGPEADVELSRRLQAAAEELAAVESSEELEEAVYVLLQVHTPPARRITTVTLHQLSV